jgi:alkylation response protein AidB-like acyl-CoA dehydrogenase
MATMTFTALDNHLRTPVDDEIVGRARALRPRLAANAVRCEAERRIPDENLVALEDAGLLDLLTPARNGGLGSTMCTSVAVSAELARGCSSTAWVQTLLNVTTWATSALSERAQKEIFDTATPARFCGVLNPSGVATAVPGGYRVRGSWPFASGCLHANWAAVGALLEGEDGTQLGPGIAHIPMSALTIDDTWHVAGMCGTGSNTVVADDVFVPDHLVLPMHGGPLYDGAQVPSDRWPVGSVLAVVLAGPLLGMATAALDAVRDNAPKRAISYTTYGAQTDSAPLVRDLAQAACEIDAATLLVMRAAAQVDAIGAGAGHTPLDDARLRGWLGHATEVLRGAVSSLTSIGGAGSFADVSPIQRHWRDLNVASRHAFLATGPTLETYGRAMFDLDSVLLLV